jgi:recombination protein RecR
LAYHLLKLPLENAKALSDAIVDAKEKTRLCEECFTFTDHSPCRICSNPERDGKTICVVERPSDVFSIEQASVFKGRYHVLHGVLSPLDGVGPEELKIRELLKRLRLTDQNTGPEEIILGLNPSVEGEATALYLTRMIKPLGIRVTQLASGIPVGGQLEYADRQTLGKALLNRVEMN